MKAKLLFCAVLLGVMGSEMAAEGTVCTHLLGKGNTKMFDLKTTKALLQGEQRIQGDYRLMPTALFLLVTYNWKEVRVNVTKKNYPYQIVAKLGVIVGQSGANIYNTCSESEVRGDHSLDKEERLSKNK